VTPKAQNAARAAALQQAPLNAWIALSDDETKIVAEGHSYQEVADQLDRMGNESAVVVKTPPSWDLLSV
jgi:TPP-dependent indolepyruvate ferredoxin oxidoreductase alpha subunit